MYKHQVLRNYPCVRFLSVLILGTLVIQLRGQTHALSSYPDSVVNKRLVTVIVAKGAIFTGGMFFLGSIWYKDRERMPFHFDNDIKGHLQLDKTGHAYSAYHESRLGYQALRWAGVNKKKALIYGGTLGIILQAPIEIFDGLYDGQGFSAYDFAANTGGSVLFMVQQGLFDEQIILMKFSYSPSVYPTYYDKLGVNHVESFFLDYNAHTYWLSCNIRKVTGITSIPSWLNLAVGYSGNGMLGEYENVTFYKGKPVPYLERYRQFLFSLDVDFLRIRTRSKMLRTVFQYLNMFKIPFPAIEFNSKGKLGFHSVYF
ncbi:MAG: DUF2279 domain-containing protein [Bacteroidales bacterium]|nr:DUF2279 domain-containing protein [Bacteroidales bacterium]MDZ4204605.1 DUF2279 domain-containing protein [Bacteroidales bacterium]